MQPLTTALVRRYLDFLPKQTYPIRTGVHPNTAFGLGFALDYAVALGDAALKDAVVARSRDYFLGDNDYPAKLEPNGSDFLSPALVEADLMRRVLSPEEFARWFEAYLPAMGDGQPGNLLTIVGGHGSVRPAARPPRRPEPEPGMAMRNIAAALPTDARARAFLAAAGHRHAVDALQHVATGHYEGEHTETPWFASASRSGAGEAPAL